MLVIGFKGTWLCAHCYGEHTTAGRCDGFAPRTHGTDQFVPRGYCLDPRCPTRAQEALEYAGYCAPAEAGRSDATSSSP